MTKNVLSLSLLSRNRSELTVSFPVASENEAYESLSGSVQHLLKEEHRSLVAVERPSRKGPSVVVGKTKRR